MACFIVPAAEAAVTTVVTKIIRKKENGQNRPETALRFSDKLRWLNTMLWGGSGLLAFEHLWHGEVTPFFPFLTAASNAADTQAMLHEMATVGTGMAALVTCAWGGMVIVSNLLARKSPEIRGSSAEGVEG